MILSLSLINCLIINLRFCLVLVKEIASTDAESAALIEAMLLQDQYDNPYVEDIYGNTFEVGDDQKLRNSDDEDGIHICLHHNNRTQRIVSVMILILRE